MASAIPDAHPGYISGQQYEEIQQRLRQNAQAYGIDRRHGPPREGPVLLQGRVVCGFCGNRMSARYHRLGEHLAPEYLCNRDYMQRGDPVWFGILFIINMEMGYITPPFGYNLFYMRSVVPLSVMSMREIYMSVLPFILIQAVCLVVLILFPQIALWLSGLMK